MNGGILNLNNALQDVTSFAGIGGTVNLGAQRTPSDPIDYHDLAGAPAGAGGLIKDGSGKLSLTGANTFSGGTIDGGILSAYANNGPAPPPGRCSLKTTRRSRQVGY